MIHLQRGLRRLAAAGAAAAVAGVVLLLPAVERSADASGPGGAPTPLPLIVVAGAPTPVPITGPRLDPPAIPHTDVLLPLVVYDQLLSPPPIPAQEANAAADAIREPQEAQGRGITTATSQIASGLTLFAPRQQGFQVTYFPAAPRAATAAPMARPVYAAPTQLPGQSANVITKGIPSPATLNQGSVPVAPVAPVVAQPAPTPAAPAVTLTNGIPTVSKREVLLQAQAVAPAPYVPLPAPTQVPAAPGIPSAHNVPVIVVEPGGLLPAPAIQEPAVLPALTGPDIACNDFNQGDRWASHRQNYPSDVWSDWYAGWGPFAVDDGLYQAKNVTFSLERTVGPGSNAGPNEHSAKIASNQPYAAGFGSPLFGVPPGAVVTVSVNYLIYDHNDHGYDYDWASLGVKPDAHAEGARYVNGYARGQWATLMTSVRAGQSGRIMVLIQAQSPGALNSNIYFDNVRIWIDGQPVLDCTG